MDGSFFLFVFLVYFLIIGCVCHYISDKRKKGENFPAKLFIEEYWDRALDFTGKTTRKRFWLTVIQVPIVYFFILGIPIFLYVFGSLYNSSFDVEEIESLTRNISLISWIGAIINFVPGISLQIRRLRDIGKESAWILLSFVPFISFVLIFWYSKPSFTKRYVSYRPNRDNKYSDRDDLNDFDLVEDKLAKLTSMVERGVISEEEYEELRKKTLGL